MDQSVILFSQWLDTRIWTIVTACCVVYVAFSLRFVVYWLLIYHRGFNLSNLPREIPVPRDVSIGIGLAVATASVSLGLSVLLKDVSGFGVLIAMTISALVVFASTMPLVMPLYFYRRARRQWEEEAAREL